MKRQSLFHKITAVLLVLCMLMGMPAVAVFAEEAEAESPIALAEMGKLGVFYCIYTMTNGKDSVKSHKIDTNDQATKLIETLNEDYKAKAENGDPDLIAVYVKLCADLTTYNFLRNDDYAFSVDLGGHTWTVTETYYDRNVTAAYSMQHTRANYYDISIYNGTMTFRKNDTAPIACCGGTITIDHVTFKDCVSEADSIYSDLYPSQRYFGIINLQVRTNDTGLEDTTGTKLNMKNVTFQGCISDHGGTCVAAWLPGCIIEAENCLFEDCCTTGDYGGVLYTRGDSQNVTFKNCRFLNCHAHGDGGVVYVKDDNGTYRFENCVAMNCYSENSDGGFLFVDGEYNTFSGGERYDDRSMLIDCRAASDGGAIYTSLASGYGNYNTFTGFNFFDCTAGKAHDLSVLKNDGGDHDGGAIYCGGSHNTVTNCDFYRNYAEEGGAVFIEYGNGRVQNCTFEFNESWEVEGNAVYVNASDCSVVDSVFRSGWILSADISGDECYQSGLSKYTEDAVNTFFKGTGTKEDPYLISTGYEMNWLAQNTKGYKSTYEGKYFKLTDNIRAYIPAGIYTDSTKRSFSGNFDGDGRTIEFWHVGTEANTAVFGYAKNAYIHDLIVEGVIAGGGNTAGVVALAENCTIENCRNKAEVSAPNTHTAGIVAHAKDTTVKDCVNNGVVRGNYQTAGIAACAEGSTVIENCSNYGTLSATHMSLGGIAGECYQVTIKNCLNNAPVTIAKDYVGGIAAVVHYGTVINCINTASGTVKAYGDRAGGIVGATFNSNPLVIQNCANYGKLDTANGCGIIDHVDGTLTVTGCFNAGEITSGSNNGPIATAGCGGTFSQCFYVSGGASDTHGTALPEADCGKKLVTRMNNYITDKRLASDGWLDWIVGGSDYKNLATVNLQGGEIGFLPGEGTKKSPYLITNIRSLEYLSEELLQGNDFYGKYIVLQKSLQNAITAPLGDESHPFRGFLEGRGHYVSIAISTGKSVGLFAALQDATVQNLAVKGTISSLDGSTQYAGGIAGKATNSTVRGCSSEADITVTAKNSSSYAGGILGYIKNTSVYDCINYGDVACENAVAGGIVGNCDGSTVDLCQNEGEIGLDLAGEDEEEERLGADIAGGIVGLLSYLSNVTNCSNSITGTIKAVDNAGGIVGKTNDYQKKLIANCVNKAKAAATSGSAGGILGGEAKRRGETSATLIGGGELKLKDAYGNPITITQRIQPNELTVENCFSSGMVAKGSNSGSIAALDCPSTFINNYYMTSKGPNDTTHGQGFSSTNCKKTTSGSPIALLNDYAKTKSYASWDKVSNAPGLVLEPVKYALSAESPSDFASVFAGGSLGWMLGMLGIGVGVMAVVAFFKLKKKKTSVANA